MHADHQFSFFLFKGMDAQSTNEGNISMGYSINMQRTGIFIPFVWNKWCVTGWWFLKGRKRLERLEIFYMDLK